VLGVARLLQDTPLSTEQRQHVDVINSSSAVLLTLLNDLLDLGKLESGQMTLRVEPSSVLDTVESTCLLLYSMAQDKGVDLTWKVDPSLPAQLLFDSSRLQQILLK
jgi:signal transduction histidine kinase